jgi:prepilin-type N-terminal cleavage/methylation domain-containing protein
MLSKSIIRKGFTLIELLVVIAIVGLLSSVILSSLQNARLKSQDAAIIASVLEFRKLVELDRSETNSYANLQKGWASSADNLGAAYVTTCEGRGFAGTYASKAIEICNSIVKNSTTGFRFLTSVDTTLSGVTLQNSYSISAYLPYKRRNFCVGSSGRSSDTSAQYNYSGAGCYSNP